MTVIFFTSSYIEFSFDLLNAIDPLNVYIFANTGAGSGISFPVAATSVTVDTNGNGDTGNWAGSGIGFQGAPDLSTYTVTFSKTLLNLGIDGTFTLKTVSSRHCHMAIICGSLRRIPKGATRLLTQGLTSVAQVTTFVAHWKAVNQRKCFLILAG